MMFQTGMPNKKKNKKNWIKKRGIERGVVIGLHKLNYNMKATCLSRFEKPFAKVLNLQALFLITYCMVFCFFFFTFSWLILSCSLSSDWTLRSSTSSRKCWRCLDDSSSSSLRHASNSRAETPLNSYGRNASLHLFQFSAKHLAQFFFSPVFFLYHNLLLTRRSFTIPTYWVKLLTAWRSSFIRATQFNILWVSMQDLLHTSI